MVSLAGILKLYLGLPEVLPTPGLVFLFLVTAGAVGAVGGGKTMKAMPGIAAMIAALTWGLSQLASGWLVDVALRASQNTMVAMDPARAGQMGVVVAAGIGLVAVFLAWRGLENVIETSTVRERSSPEISLDFSFVKDLFKKKEPDPLPSVAIGRDEKTKEPVVIRGSDRFLHSIAIGPTGCGKTSRVLGPMIYQDIKRIAGGEKLGITVIEPKGEREPNTSKLGLTYTVAAWCEEFGVPYTLLDPAGTDTARYNPLQGDAVTVAEDMKTVLTSLFGAQEDFFRQVQETAARQVILLLKRLKGDDLTLLDVVRALRDPEILKRHVEELERRQGPDDLTSYFRREILSSLKDKYLQFAIGLRQQLEDITGNALLQRVLIGDGDISLDRHLSEGGVLLVNTAMGPLAKLGDTFGQLVIMMLQNAVFRRPGTEWTRTPHYLYIDELPLYLTSELKRLFSLGRAHRCGCTVAMQALSQLVINKDPSFVPVVMTNCRNQLVFGGLYQHDAREFEWEFGKVEGIDRQVSYDNRILVPEIFPESFKDSRKDKPRYTYTGIKELSEGKFIYHIVRNGTYLPPGIGVGELPPAPKPLGEIHPRPARDETLEKAAIVFRSKNEPETVPAPVTPAVPEQAAEELSGGEEDDGFWNFN